MKIILLTIREFSRELTHKERVSILRALRMEALPWVNPETLMRDKKMTHTSDTVLTENLSSKATTTIKVIE